MDSQKIDSIKESLKDIETSILIFKEMQVKEANSTNSHSFLYGAAQQTIKSIEQTVNEAIENLELNN
ncbi:hypothetical protein NYZ42_16950 [Acinetobacter baumannii]|nr:hypothetical protein [Acinetobacter baumannii]